MSAPLSQLAPVPELTGTEIVPVAVPGIDTYKASLNEVKAFVADGLATPEQVGAAIEAQVPGLPDIVRLKGAELLSDDPLWGIDATGETDATASLVAFLTAASEGPGRARIRAGTYLIDDAGPAAGGAFVTIRRSLRVDCDAGVEFKTRNLDRTAIRIQIDPTGPENGRLIDVEWYGGRGDISDSKVSTSVPFLAEYPPQSGKQGTSGATDFLVFSGSWTDGGGNLRVGFRLQRASGVTVYAGAHWQTAGGDTGIAPAAGALISIVEDCEFYGCRDLGIYGSTTPADAPQKHVYRRNKFFSCFAAASCKRSPSGWVIEDCEADNCVIAWADSQLLGLGYPIGQDTRIERNRTTRCEITVRTSVSYRPHAEGNVARDMGCYDKDGLPLSIYGVPVFWELRGTRRARGQRNEVVGVGPEFRNEEGYGGSLVRGATVTLTNTTGSPVTVPRSDGTSETVAAGATVTITNDDNEFSYNVCERISSLGADAGANRTNFWLNRSINCRIPGVSSLGTGSTQIYFDPVTGLPTHISGALYNDGSASSPIIARRLDPTTGFGFAAGEIWGGTAGAKRWSATSGGFDLFVPLRRTAAAGLTAAGTTQSGALALTADLNRIATVASGAGVRLPAAAAGREIAIANGGAAVLRVYPASGETVDGALADLPSFVLPGERVTFSAFEPAAWLSSKVKRVVPLAQSGVAVSHTGDTTQTQLVSVPVPANLVGRNDQIRITSLWTGTGSGSKTMRVGVGSTAVYSAPFTTNLSQRHQQQIALRGSQASSVGAPSSLSSGWGSSASGLVAPTADFSADTSIVFHGTLATGSETITLESYSIELLQGVA